MGKIEIVEDEIVHKPADRFENLIRLIRNSNFSQDPDSSDGEVADAVTSSLRR